MAEQTPEEISASTARVRQLLDAGVSSHRQGDMTTRFDQAALANREKDLEARDPLIVTKRPKVSTINLET